MNYGPNTFQSQGRWYTLNITLVPDGDMFPDDTCVSLDGMHIEEFSYTSELNSLVLTGQILYTDEYGLVDKLLEQQQCICRVMFARNKTNEDGIIVDNQLDIENAFQHTFIVDSIKIVARERTKIKYQIDLVSYSWYSCISNISFSNNDKDPEPLFDILKKCIRDKAELAVNDTFDKVKTDVKINYASQVNDNLFKIFNYLMDFLYFQSKKDASLKFLVYNFYKDEYSLLDIADEKTFIGSSATMLSFFKSNVEQLVQSDESNIGSYTNGKSRTDLYRAMFARSINYYDFQSNKLSVDDEYAADKSIVSYMNEHVSYDDYELKYHALAVPETLKYIDSTSYWNHPPAVYFSVLESMYSNGALTLNTSGEIMRQCGFTVTLAVDRNMNALTDESIESFQRLKTKYTGFEGTWLALKVVSIICPSRSLFRQKIALFRNFTKRAKEK